MIPETAFTIIFWAGAAIMVAFAFFFCAMVIYALRDIFRQGL